MKKVEIKNSVKNLLVEFKEAAIAHSKNQTVEIKKKLDEMNKEIDKISLDVKKAGAKSPDVSESFKKSKIGQAFNTYLMKGFEGLTGEQKSLKVAVTPSMQKDMVAYDGSGGGFLVAPPEFIQEINKEVIEFAPVYDLVRKRPSGISGIVIPKRNALPTAYWVNEGEALQQSQASYGEDEIPVDELTASTVASNRILQNEAFDIESEIISDQAESFSVALAKAIVTGGGVKRPQGMVNNVNSENSGSLTLTANILSKFPSNLKTAYRNNATWLGHRETFGVIRALLASNSATFMLWAQTLAEGRPELLLGRPIAEAVELVAPQASGSFTANQVPLILGDFNRGYTLAEGVEYRIMRNPFRLSNRTIFEIQRFVGGKVTRKEAILQMKITSS